MTTTGQFLSPIRQARIQPVEQAARPMVGYAEDYPDGLKSGMHSHPKAQLLFALSGAMQITTHEAQYMVPPSAALYLPVDCEHDITMDGLVQMRALFLRVEAVVHLPNSPLVLQMTPLLRELVLAACSEPLEWDRAGRGQHISALALDEIARSKVIPSVLPTPKDARLRRVTDALQCDPLDPRGVEDWADLAGATSRTLSRLFLAETGMSFRQWRRQLRMGAAFVVLSSGKPIQQAAFAAGYDSVPAFGAAFLQTYGMTPGQARVKALGVVTAQG